MVFLQFRNSVLFPIPSPPLPSTSTPFPDKLSLKMPTPFFKPVNYPFFSDLEKNSFWQIKIFSEKKSFSSVTQSIHNPRTKSGYVLFCLSKKISEKQSDEHQILIKIHKRNLSINCIVFTLPSLLPYQHLRLPSKKAKALNRELALPL